MKLYHLIIAFCIFIGTQANAQVYEPKDIVVDLSYGWPNLYSKIVKAAYNTGNYDVSLGSFGPAAIKVEYLFSKRIGVGLHVNYAATSVSGTSKGFVPGKTEGQTYDYKASVNRFRFMPTVNLHLGKSEKVDPYLSFGLGYAGTSFSEKSEDPYVVPVKLRNPFPLAVRAEFGTRYFFTDYIGAHLKVGFGSGALLGAGLSGKF